MILPVQCDPVHRVGVLPIGPYTHSKTLMVSIIIHLHTYPEHVATP